MKSREALKDKKRIVIKIGSSTLTFANGRINFERIEMFARVLSNLRNSGKEVVLVSSGAIAVGSGILGLDVRPNTVALKQAVAAVGQAELIKIYQKFFSEYNQLVAQVLITRDVMINPIRNRNAKNTFTKLLELNVIPIVNENDTVATDEIEFGDNDTLSANVATLVNADLLILMSDIDGLYNADPRKNAEAKIISTVNEINSEIENIATGAGSSFSIGGMVTKISAAKLCNSQNIDMVITNGQDPHIIYDILEGKEIGTLFVAKKEILKEILN